MSNFTITISITPDDAQDTSSFEFTSSELNENQVRDRIQNLNGQFDAWILKRNQTPAAPVKDCEDC